MIVSVCKLDPAQKPRALDIRATDGPNKGKTKRAIYEFKDGRLRICLAQPEKKRPKDFASEAGSGHTRRSLEPPVPVRDHENRPRQVLASVLFRLVATQESAWLTSNRFFAGTIAPGTCRA